jgi:hypothetical protein
MFVVYQMGVSYSALLLCKIFWSLGTAVHKENDKVVEVEVQDFDEDAEMQAGLWN